MIRRLAVDTKGQGLHEITAAVQDAVRGANIAEGVCYAHDAEAPDDMPSHIKAALTATSLSIPAVDGKLALGTSGHLPVGASPPRQPPRRGIAHRHLSR